MTVSKKVSKDVSVIDNFLPSDTFDNIAQQMLGNNFPWFYYPHKTVDEETDDVFDSQFAHTFYRDGEWNSQAMWAVEPILSILNPKEIVRIKANLTVPATNIRTWGMHTDFDDPSITTGIFYLTDCDGGTVFSDGSVVNSVANRFVHFPANTFHSGQTFTNAKARCVINFNVIL